MGTIFLGLNTRNLGTETREMTNPFTGEKSRAHIDDGATPEELAAGVGVLDSANAAPPDPEGFRRVPLANGRYMCINFESRGGEIEIEGGFHTDAITTVFRLASASGMLVTSTIDPALVAVLPGQRHPGIDERWPTAVDIDSPESLLQWVVSELKNGRIA
jgi:hypothetical protein